ncbi:Peptidoglycan/LPS O-acetylase OafA/YrhL, contains acyltransferase and SGNH-hydrolase domains [Bryocella elongata]|uniref:Peptidoglycan/LPS O-acetylase OafA/YrhL, contains acyltransferase and SGNH-hydrolase domains n=1 Tax=Bryocella elongata TaxID=863522 RepID=A0A1H5Y594_9BACT|nr:acyltransferase [Bryocella elongata]SEG18867.1 Peptidoglycan/LPS O-acetylase OafA/YrhL, contains acyltransferase and SGNH-hydrolase domains [Bryocella elongata]
MAATLPVTGNTEHTRPENRAFYPALDGLRALALLLVVLEHYREIPWGWTGVDLFFVLSGFLITGILYDSRNDAHRVRNFYVRRTLRIFPLYYGVMAAVLFSWPLFHWHLTWGWIAWPLYAGNLLHFLPSFAYGTPRQWLVDFQPTGSWHGHAVRLYLGHFWSLCVEEQFYLLWPWAVFAIKDRRKIAWFCAASLPFCLALRLLASHLAPARMLPTLLYSFLPLRFDALLLGGLVAMLIRGPHRELLLLSTRRALLACVLVGAICASFLPAARLFLPRNAHPSWAYTWGLTAIDILAAMLILAAIDHRSLVYRALRFGPFRWIGRISYGGYVFHDIWHYELSRWIANHPPRHPAFTTTVTALALTITVAWLSFRFYESPFLELKERCTLREPAPPVPAV